MGAKIHIGNTTDFEHEILDEDDVIVDISSPVTLSITFVKPDKSTTFTRTATLVSDGLDGKLHYTCLTTDLDVRGDWARQAYVKLTSGEWTGQLISFAVHRTLRG